MADAQQAEIRLAYWSDRFTILSTQLMPKRYFGLRVWRLVLLCRGRHAVAIMHELRMPSGWYPTPGQRVAAALRIGDQPGACNLHVQVIKPC